MTETRIDTAVVIAGAGPTGLMLASELRLAGVDVVLLDRLAQRQTVESRAGGLHPRSLEVLDQRGVLQPFLAAGRPLGRGHFSALPLDFSGFATRHPYTLVLLQTKIERLLERRAAELGAHVRWSSEVVGVDQDESGVTVTVSGPHGVERVRARYLVGCDGGRSAVRTLAGIDFPGTPATMTALLGDVELADPPAEPMIMQRRGAHGDHTVLSLEAGWHRVIVNQYDQVPDRAAPVTLEQLRAALVATAGTDFGMHSPRWLSRFNDAARQATRYRQGRVLLAGDAAHIHLPAGGQGLNTGLQDAANLGWKLAAVLHGHAPEHLLDSYHAERHPVAARVLNNTRAQSLLSRPGPHTDALRAVMAELIGFDQVNEYLGSMLTGLDIRYPLAEDHPDPHPLLGRRVPDVDLSTPTGDRRLVSLLSAGRPVLLDLTAGPAQPDLAEAASAWADRVDLVRAHCRADHWVVPCVGAVPAPAALLIRPDGYLAWVAPRTAESGAADTEALRSALTTWFGPATAGGTTR
ncbi:FAD-dependent monooxygenase [Goodfellowiella coeruleoviolacea]|uniref:3-(3-hydroxy-phenyl)propionate hydroxylase n=1 Tax=Goodfellowiella coeruleoviolacea TaxID=334858 RepID=A0AAE3GC50_9PSEU|nr:FAD-dependent monooxygenase [Goodfellowiella coeruleoviolacea]MCP2164384.1 3-(3-hydroxy-phenyl)propionate hydroxylase [Goodfellowiella coeruleoviolacea]